ncbi:MAG TPA: hypothetical protein VHV77_13945, partial [Pirellulales bacterium]|nr:hypothetical protein [Pirellulales bacterium]
TLYTIEPEMPTASDGASPVEIDTHGMNPGKVLCMAASLGRIQARVLVLGCEPTPISDQDDMQMGLSLHVQAAIELAVDRIESLIAEHCGVRIVQSRGCSV